jgi:tRNA-splicing ligase RtcB
MKKVIGTENKPIKLWLDDIEEGALQQAKNIANLPFLFKHIAIMPDSHQGYGMPIGGVAALKDVVSPNMVGVDIGCGMCAVKTSLTEIDTETLKEIIGEIRKVIPVGFAKHAEAQDETLMPHNENSARIDWHSIQGLDVVPYEYNNALKSLGTLGGGNHFIEIQKGSDGHIWIMIHSGSRNLGKQVADHYNKLAVKNNEIWHTKIPKEWQLAFLPLYYDEDIGRKYLIEMQYCVDFAFANRKLMMERCKKAFLYHAGKYSDVQLKTIGIEFDPIINIAHNYATLENHFGENVWVHRKGATLAREGTIGIIPGSQGSKSYIVRGKGNKDSFESCSHGAGRLMSRTKAQETLNLEEEKRRLDERGILHAIRGKNDLDEAAGAYKPIEEVMRNQSDLVEILVELTPLGVIKG